MSNPKRTLTKNKVSTFIIRIDLDMSSELDYGDISDALGMVFPNRQIQISPHFNVNLDSVRIDKAEAKKFLFLIEPSVRLEISPVDKAIIFSSNYYTTNDLYKERLGKVVEVFSERTGGTIKSRRIGMRFINTFPANKDGNLPTVLNASETKILKESLAKKNDLSRLIIVDEYLKEDYRIRVQYGVPNKFYPNKISSQDVILDIDVYSEGLQPIENWCEMISVYNHAAFDTFIRYIRGEVIDYLR
ncbi:TIGR04255 family protein [Prevotella sp. ne3005]|uniref:TIGR04255 family protein n=1 Tax=Prevotella sp. ne3005 TaxID=1761887 RepID=UPI0008BC30F2|nr:TIGR04255 family protein [Prevotella sp. ne3005]SEM53277.1 TIGR04255 family protein [Prevotella sp. ne3005]